MLLKAPTIPNLIKVPPARIIGLADKNNVNIATPIPPIPPANPTLKGE
jgi:hypothetical protein